ncbi:hypothetical protein [Candidatus Venteria ishoeyi]|uniref:Uncharacterized protein n=1 Tax=Candidatus Venteria ishoeyi TaxID=1899563 RepID=A0A1H6FBL1_9GAMM|nr:hypothetical protein [Candidatus Venteria ishoeyi]SEH07482.1 Uncharacterised protein [Candidatus Venteria ishoeyi]
MMSNSPLNKRFFHVCPFHLWFSPAYCLPINTELSVIHPLFAARMQQLGLFLEQQEQTLIAELLHQKELIALFPKLSIEQTESMLQQHYALFCKAMSSGELSLYAQWVEQQQGDDALSLSVSQSAQLTQAFLAYLSPLQDIWVQAWCQEQFNAALRASELSEQIQQISQQIEMIAWQTINEFCMDYDEQALPDASDLQQSLLLLLQDWHNTLLQHPDCPEVMPGLEFLRLFAHHLLFAYPLLDGSWGRLLIKLDWALSGFENTGQDGIPVGHCLSDALETLLAATPDFPFIRLVMTQALPHYAVLDTPISDWLLIALLLRTRPETLLHLRYLQSLNLCYWQQQRASQLETLQQAHYKAFQALQQQLQGRKNSAINVGQMESFTAVCTDLNKLIDSLDVYDELNQQAAPAALDDKLWRAVLYESCMAVATTDNPQWAIQVFRYHFSLRLAPDLRHPHWQQVKQLNEALQHFSVDSKSVRLVIWREAIRLILKEFDIIVQENLFFAQHTAVELIDASQIRTQADKQDTQNHYIVGQLALNNCLYSPRRAVLLAKMQCARYLQAHADNIEQHDLDTLIQSSAQSFHEMVNEHHGLQDTLAMLQAALPEVRLGVKLSQQLSSIMQQLIFWLTLEHSEVVGKTGEMAIKSCLRDVCLILLRIAQGLEGAAFDPQATLAWWQQHLQDATSVQHRQLLMICLTGLPELLVKSLGEEARRYFQPDV